jgi:hypothetical protein
MAMTAHSLLDRLRRPRNPVILLPAAAGSAGLGVLVSQVPAVAAGLALVLLTTFSWELLTALLSLASVINRPRLTIGGVNVQLAHIVLIPLAVRVFAVTRREILPRWRNVEFAIVGFVMLQFATSYFHAVNVRQSVQSAGLLALGVLAYLVVYTGVCTRERLIFAARALLLAGLFAGAVGVAAAASHALLGTNFGISDTLQAAGGLAKEHDILGSMAGSTAIAFLVLSREPNPVFSRLFSLFGFWVSLAAMLASLARGAWIGFAICFLLLVPFRRLRYAGRRMLGRGAVTVLILAVAGAGFLYLSFTQQHSTESNTLVLRGSQIVDLQSGSGAARTQEWRTALDDVKGSPLLGLGTNSYGQRHLGLRVDEPGYLGNLYIRTLYDSGIVGLALLLYFVHGLLRPVVRLRWSTGDLTPVAIAIGFAYVLLLVAYAATDASLQVWPWLFAGLLRPAVAMAFRQQRAGRKARSHLGNGGPPRRAELATR